MINKLHWVRLPIHPLTQLRWLDYLGSPLPQGGERAQIRPPQRARDKQRKAWANYAPAYSRLTAARNAVISAGDFKW
jgi:hypothetical protein